VSEFCIGSKKWPGLSKLIEECGELLQVAGKLIGSEGKVKHFDGSDLKERLEEELSDVRAAMVFFIQTNGLNGGKIDTRARQKLEMFHTWHAEHRTKSFQTIETREDLVKTLRELRTAHDGHDTLNPGCPFCTGAIT
jgi:NTP pyrophosphatase (non-canonical NTP hydrolase)